jgi:hypothetical protein
MQFTRGQLNTNTLQVRFTAPFHGAVDPGESTKSFKCKSIQIPTKIIQKQKNTNTKAYV